MHTRISKRHHALAISWTSSKLFQVCGSDIFLYTMVWCIRPARRSHCPAPAHSRRTAADLGCHYVHYNILHMTEMNCTTIYEQFSNFCYTYVVALRFAMIRRNCHQGMRTLRNNLYCTIISYRNSNALCCDTNNSYTVITWCTSCRRNIISCKKLTILMTDRNMICSRNWNRTSINSFQIYWEINFFVIVIS